MYVHLQRDKKISLKQSCQSDQLLQMFGQSDKVKMEAEKRMRVFHAGIGIAPEKTPIAMRMQEMKTAAVHNRSLY
jgi:hypothetical protein